MPRVRLATFVITAAFAGASASGEDPADGSYYDGIWSVRVPCHQRALCSARVVLRDSAGTWEELAGGSLSKGACRGQKMPLTVQRATPTQLAFTVWGTNVAPDCPNISVLVTPVNTRTLDGVFEFGVQELHEHDSDHTRPTDLTRQLEGKAASAPVEARPPADRSIRMQRR